MATKSAASDWKKSLYSCSNSWIRKGENQCSCLEGMLHRRRGGAILVRIRMLLEGKIAVAAVGSKSPVVCCEISRQVINDGCSMSHFRGSECST